MTSWLLLRLLALTLGLYSPHISQWPLKCNPYYDTPISKCPCGCPSQSKGYVLLTVLGTLPYLHFSSLSLWPHLLLSPSPATHWPPCCLSDIASILPHKGLFSCYFQCLNVLLPDIMISSFPLFMDQLNQLSDQRGLCWPPYITLNYFLLPFLCCAYPSPNIYMHICLLVYSMSPSTGM